MADWDISTATHWNSVSLVESGVFGPQSGAMSSDGSRAAFWGGWGSTKRVRSYTLSTPFDLSTAVAHSTSAGFAQSTYGTSAGFTASRDGRHFYQKTDASLNPIRVNWWEMTTPWDASTWTHRGQLSLTGNTSGSGGLAIDESGTRLYLCNTETSPNKLEQYALSTAWDVTTATLVLSKDTFFFEDALISGDGFHFITFNGADRFERYDLSTAFDASTLPSTATPHSVFYPGYAYMFGSAVSPTGNAIYVQDGNTEIYHAFDVNYVAPPVTRRPTVGFIGC